MADEWHHQTVSTFLDEMMRDYLGLNLTSPHHGYDLSASAKENDDLMKFVFHDPWFPFLDHAISFEKLLSLEDLLSYLVHEEEDYKKMKD